MALFSRLRSMFGVGEQPAPADETAHKVAPGDDVSATTPDDSLTHKVLADDDVIHKVAPADETHYKVTPGDDVSGATPDDDLAPLVGQASAGESYDQGKYFVADSFSFGVEREMKESSEKGGTEDINIGVGELQDADPAQKVLPTDDDVGGTTPDDGLSHKVAPGDDVGSTPPDDGLELKWTPDDTQQKVLPTDDDVGGTTPDDTLSHKVIPTGDVGYKVAPPGDDVSGIPPDDSLTHNVAPGDDVSGTPPDDGVTHKVAPPGDDVGATPPDDSLTQKVNPDDTQQKVIPTDDDVGSTTPDDTLSHKVIPTDDDVGSTTPDDTLSHEIGDDATGVKPPWNAPVEKLTKIPDPPAPPTHAAPEVPPAGGEAADALQYEAVEEAELDGADLSPADAPRLSVDDMKSDEGVKIADPVEPEGVKVDDMKSDDSEFFGAAGPGDEPTTLVDLGESTSEELQQAAVDADDVVELSGDLDDIGGGGGGDDLLDD